MGRRFYLQQLPIPVFAYERVLHGKEERPFLIKNAINFSLLLLLDSVTNDPCLRSPGTRVLSRASIRFIHELCVRVECNTT